MSVTIRILPEQITNKIAAGEVVERPASVVKELVENALDAGACDISIEIESGGKRLIRVTDDGHGMSREDALLSLERHATSKIMMDSDLFALTSLGFRGEALPSIASVCRFTLSTRMEGSIEGTEIYAEGGRIKEVKACGMARGTVATVRNLFFNTPARLKFLRSAETEGGHVGEFLTRLALSRPEVRFTAINDGRIIFTVGKGGLRDRVAALLGDPLAEGLFPVAYEEGGCMVSGLVGRPDTNRSSATLVYTYINGRFIRDRVVQHAVLQAYRTLMERGRYPVVILFINLPPAEVDVNVHPTKHEVRFRNQGAVHDCIQRGVESLLRGTPWVKKSGGVPRAPYASALYEAGSKPPREAVTVPPTAPAPPEAGSVSEERRQSVREALAAYRPDPERRPPPPSFNFPISPKGIPTVEPPDMSPAEAGSSMDGFTRGFFSSLTVIGQLHATYLLCQSDEGLIIIDQHAAHERVAFEKLRSQLHSGKVASQGLLLPETIDFSFGEAAAVREHREELSRLGFELEPFGGSTWLLKEVPCLLSGGGCVGTLRDIIEELRGVGRSRAFSDVAEEVLTTIACHSVVRGKRSLAPPEIDALFARMDEAGFAANCPHGRPVYKTLSLGEIAKLFKRG